MRIGLPCKLGEELMDGYILVGFDKGLYTATLYGRKSGCSDISFFREDAFKAKYILDLPLGVCQDMSIFGVEKNLHGELWGVIWDGNVVWGDFVIPQQYHVHQKYSTEIINRLLKDILPDMAA